MRGLTSLVLAASCFGLAKAQCEQKDNGDGPGISCTGLTDGDLPNTDFTGSQAFIELLDSPDLTSLPTDSFGFAYSSSYLVQNCENVATLEPDFLGVAMDSAREVRIQGLPMLTSFDWTYLIKMSGLEQFELSGTGLTSLEVPISWPSTLESLNLDGSIALVEIPADLIRSANSLVNLTMVGINGAVAIRSNAFHISQDSSPSLSLSLAGDTGAAVIEDNIFGNVAGGDLWGSLDLTLPDFPEGAFRLMLKSHFDLASEGLLYTSNGAITVRDCGCAIAWLYKDANQFGIVEYQALVGPDNVICSAGPVLETEDAAFIQQMKDCPVTEMPWPDYVCDGWAASGSFSDTVPDPEDCTCFYHCNSEDQVLGHDCCQDGLGYDPELPGCDWLANQPDCPPVK